MRSTTPPRRHLTVAPLPGLLAVALAALQLLATGCTSAPGPATQAPPAPVREEPLLLDPAHEEGLPRVLPSCRAALERVGPDAAGAAAFAAFRRGCARAARSDGDEALATRLEELRPGEPVPVGAAPLARELLREYTVARYGERMVADLSDLVRFRTVETPGEPPGVGEEFARQRELLAARAEELGLGFESFGGRVEELTLPATGPADAPIVAILTHGDVQGVEGQAWTLPPWEGTVEETPEGRRVVGRGTEDDKGPIVATLYALAALADTGWPRETTTKLLVANGEESSWEDVPYYLERAPVPDVTVGIDADYPVTHAQKGYGVVTVTSLPRAAASPEASAVSPELPPAPAWRLVEIAGGAGLSIIPERGEARLEPLGAGATVAGLERRARDWAAANPPARFDLEPLAGGAVRIVAHGRGGHSSVPDSGHNALGDLAAFLATLYQAGDLARDRTGDLAAFIGETVGVETDGASLGLAHRDPVMGELTASLALFDTTDAGDPRARINTRVPRGVTAEEMAAQVLARANAWSRETGAVLVSESTLYSEPHLVPAGGVLVSTLLDTWEEVIGEPGVPRAIGGSTQARLFPGGVDFGPGDPSGTYRGHGPDEYLTADELDRIARLTVTALARLTGVATGG